MNDSSGQPRTWLILLVGLVGCGVICALVLFDRFKTGAARAALEKQVSQLQADLQAQAETILGLEQENENLRERSSFSNTPAVGSTGKLNQGIEIDLAYWIEETVRLQSNTVELLSQLSARSPAAPVPPLSAQQRQAAYVALEASKQDEQQRLDQLKQKAADLLFALNVPDKVATMEPSAGLDTASLRAYWPYFEAKRERDECQLMVEVLHRRLFQERMDMAVSEARIQNP